MADEAGQAAGNGCDAAPTRTEYQGMVEAILKRAEPKSAEITLENVEDVFKYHPWGRGQQECGDAVRDALVMAAKQVLRSVPPGRLRDRALDCLVDARMLANASITFRGRF